MRTDEMAKIDPAILAILDREGAVLKEEANKQQRRRVKIPIGQQALVRFLPVELGVNRTWFARIATHWVNKRPYTCIKGTGEDFGGNPNYDCMMCNVAEDLSNHASEQISQNAKRCMANPMWIMYCLVWKRDDGQNEETVKGNEMWNAWEFPLYRSMFQDVFNYYRKGLTKSSHSILDLTSGNDFWVSHTKKGYTFDKQDSSPIISDASKLDEVTKKIWATIKFSLPQKPDVKEALAKMEDFISHSTDEEPRSAERAERPQAMSSSYSPPSAIRAPAPVDELEGEALAETKDPAPPVRKPVGDEPPSVEGASRSGLDARIRERINAMRK